MSGAFQKDRRIGARYFLLWTVAGLYYFSQGRVQRSLSHDATPWSHDLATWMTGMYLCAALTPVVLRLCRRFPIERKAWRRRAALHLLFSVLFSVAELAAHSAVLCLLGIFPTVATSFAATFLTLLSVAFSQNALTYWVILGIRQAFQLRRQYQEREKQALALELKASELGSQLARAQLGALKAQLQPHFLFNTLNAIMVLVRQQKTGDAEEMLARLSDLLRYVLEDPEAQEAPLRRELEYARLYLSIEQVRFRDRLHIGITAGPEVLDAAVPHMCLQPILENAIRHGIGRSSAAGRIGIVASQENDTLQIQVSDDGPGLISPPAGRGGGIGLTNTRARLHRLYGEHAQLRLENGAAGGAVATMVLPYHDAPGFDSPAMVEAHAVDNTVGG